MELTKQSRVVIVLPSSWDEKPLWYRQCLTNIEYPDLHGGYTNFITQWFKTHYDADLCWHGAAWSIEFPNRETYMECVLTWS
jgi:hypothetical protein